MGDLENLNAALAAGAPAAFAMLSEVGRAAMFPKGILTQTAEASGTRLNATIGQITDGHGAPLPLPNMSAHTSGLDPAMTFLYSPQAGHPRLRAAWAAHQRAHSGGSTVQTSLPLVTHGLTQGLSLVAELFADSDTTVLVAAPFWGNYRNVFALRQRARITTFPFFDGERFAIGALREALARVTGKLILLLNIPGNPTGYTPTADEVREIVAVVASHPGTALILCDDAYTGMRWEDAAAERSLFWDLAETCDPARHFVVKVDGSTKEAFFFPGRVGFFTHTARGPAEAALESKLKCIGRVTVGSPPGPSQALLLGAMEDPRFEADCAARRDVLRARWRALRRALDENAHPLLRPLPFNSGMFALIQLDPSRDAEAVRLALLADDSVGVVSIPEANALRVAYGSLSEAEIPELVQRLVQAVIRTGG